MLKRLDQSMAEGAREGTKAAVILARGLGTRMRKADPGAELAAEQAAIADAGVKAMIPIGRPFLDYVLSELSRAGYERICIVIGPEHDALRHYYTRVAPPTRLTIEFAVQREPLGTADAVLAAEQFAGGEPFVVINSDNYYPEAALRTLRNTEPPALIAFARSALTRDGNVQSDRAGRFGALDIDADGFLRSFTGGQAIAADGNPAEVYASMNCWLFTPQIFDACRKVPLSARGELELTPAVKLAIDQMGMRVRAIPMHSAVLDLSTRADIAEVERRLKNEDVTY